MPRKPRIDIPGVAQHIVQRGNDRQPCFFKDEDRRRYLLDLRELALREDCRVHAYVLMTNRVHLLLNRPCLRTHQQDQPQIHRRIRHSCCVRP